MRYHLTPIRMATVKNKQTPPLPPKPPQKTSVGEDADTWEPLFMVGSVNSAGAVENCMVAFQIMKNRIYCVI